MFYPSKNQKRPYNALEARFYIAQTGCQGRGREFESRFPLWEAPAMAPLFFLNRPSNAIEGRFLCFFKRHEKTWNATYFTPILHQNRLFYSYFTPWFRLFLPIFAQRWRDHMAEETNNQEKVRLERRKGITINLDGKVRWLSSIRLLGDNRYI